MPTLAIPTLWQTACLVDGRNMAWRSPPAGCPPLHLQAMHGMLSAAILICVFAAVTAACAYVAGRVYLAAGKRQSRRGDSS